MLDNIVVIKIGTGVLTREQDGTLDEASLVRLVTSVSELVADGVPVVMVSSGAVGAGVSALQLDGYPDDTASRQACAAVGQTRLMHAYETLFQKFQINVAQILLTSEDLDSDQRSGLVMNTLHRLLKGGNIVPIINENDSVAVEELRVGDNDMMSARVAKRLQARLLVMLSTVDGLQRADGSTVDMVTDLNEVASHVRADHGKFSIGGMASKLLAVGTAVEAGVETVIASGRKPSALAKIVAGGQAGTRFPVK
ncbi:glutamate 5-kinase [Verrucomicrobiaceae bacterium R5-34]|uniref:Glutamate 5-kinase n=1 Tax=Oceaniferula flava TaxID=2800421 RepID=A0AAE2SDV2_9BACT|nr:glutamate 5-kinase [Oceaniferula flavus]MBK1830418.1 glutamate 5-kinase [Verrucomicrobiaceae bacterium R5-34]MBK1854511.1 glutamate 5-kinase [Oceaniferula flavus]MBM1135817.1 glutamate 5-kinase [Oceaniferula flavus]